MRQRWVAKGPEFSRYGRRQELSPSMETEHWGKSPHISGWRTWGNCAGEAGKSNPSRRRWRLLWYPHVWTKGLWQQGELSATASSDPLALAGPEFVDLQHLIQMLTKHLACARGGCLESFVLWIILPVYSVQPLWIYSTDTCEDQNEKWKVKSSEQRLGEGSLECYGTGKCRKK